MKRSLILCLLFVLMPCLLVNAVASSADWQIGPFVRPVEKPIISPIKDSVFECPASKKVVHWESSDTFNPAAVLYNGDICLLYRAEDGSGSGLASHTSRIGLGKSKDGIVFKRNPKPVFYPKDDDLKGYEWFGGCEDPRIVEDSDGIFYLYYTMWNRDNPLGIERSARIGVATSKDLENWTKHGPIFKDAHDGKFLDFWHKAAAVVTKVNKGRLIAEKINGEYWMYWGEYKIYAAKSDDLIHWEPIVDDDGELVTIIQPRPDKFDSVLTEAGPPAVVTKDGIVLIYNGKNSGVDKTVSEGAYSAGQILLDKKDPLKLLDRCDSYFFKPEFDFEKTGQYPQGTVFVEGLIYRENKWYLYYGTADSYVGVAISEGSALN